jgi:hypothetical protein
MLAPPTLRVVQVLPSQWPEPSSPNTQMSVGLAPQIERRFTLMLFGASAQPAAVR